MDWLHHPKFHKERVAVIEALRSDAYDFRRIKKVIFLCGAQNSTNRDNVAEYFRRYVRDSLVFYAEAVWSVIGSNDSKSNALALEEKLASLADVVIIVVESPGTFAEIGAFAISEPLRAKLLPLLDQRFRGGVSFLETGPVRWVDADSHFAPCVWADFNRILTAMDEVQERVGRIKPTPPSRVANVLESPKHLLFFLCDLVAVFGPCPREHLTATTVDLLGEEASRVEIDLYLGLGKAMGLLGSFDSGGREMYFRLLTDGRLPSFQRRPYLDLPTLRSRVLGAMQACTACKPVLEDLARQA